MVRVNLKAPHQMRGLTLAEVAFALVISSAAALLIGSLIYMRQQDDLNALTAQQMADYAGAVQQYVSANSATLLASAGPTTPVTITTAQLQTANFLPAAFAAANPYSQTYVTKVIQPTPGQLEPLILTIGGNTIPESVLRPIAVDITADHAEGGFISALAPATAVGAGGTWSTALAPFGGSPGGGHLADGLFVSMVATVDDYLHRHYDGNPALNAMSTAINMQGNNIDSAGQVFTNAGCGVMIGGACYYGDANNAAVRPTSGNFYVENSSGAAGDIALIHNIYGDATSTFYEKDIDASDWVWGANGLSTNYTIQSNYGNVYAQRGNVYSQVFDSTGNNGWYNSTYGGGWYMSDPTWIRTYANKSIYTAGQVNAGTVVSQGRLTANEYIQINGTAYPGGFCAPNGLLAIQGGTGGLLNCRAGVWTPAAGLTVTIASGNGFEGTGSYSPYNSSYVSCPAGYVAAGAGWRTTYYSSGSASPDAMYPISASTYYFHAGAETMGTWMQPYVMCVM